MKSQILGSVRNLVDANEDTQNIYDYYAFGKELGSWTENVTNRYTYTAREYDEESEQYYYRARYYDGSGRFNRRDPAGFAAGINHFCYVGNDPANRSDPRGLRRTERDNEDDGNSYAICREKTCGPGVTKEAISVLAKVDAKWATLTTTQQDAVCDSFTSTEGDSTTGQPMWLNAWDIKELHNQKWINNPPYTPACATFPGCKSTVEVKGRCFYAGSVNYVLFGHMWKLCDNWEWTGRALITAYKGPLPGRPASGNYQASLDWFSAGYRGWPGARTPAADRPACSPTCPVGYTGAPFTVYLGTLGTF